MRSGSRRCTWPPMVYMAFKMATRASKPGRAAQSYGSQADGDDHPAPPLPLSQRQPCISVCVCGVSTRIFAGLCVCARSRWAHWLCNDSTETFMAKPHCAGQTSSSSIQFISPCSPPFTSETVVGSLVLPFLFRLLLDKLNHLHPHPWNISKTPGSSPMLAHHTGLDWQSTRVQESCC